MHQTKKSLILSYLSLILLVLGCSPKLIPASSVNNGTISSYKYIYITPTSSLTSSSGATVNGQYFSSSKTVNPSDVIYGTLSKSGLIRLPDLKQELSEETLVVNYGESGRRSVGWGGYTIEVTIQFVSAKTNSLVCSCTAEGIGSTEADDIREAITRCLDKLIEKG
jgi:hypothetical protein